MARKLSEIASIILLVGTFYGAGLAVARGVPAAWLLFVAACVIYGVITILQLLPVTSLNLTVKVTAENAPRIAPVLRDFLATIKAYTMMAISWVGEFLVNPRLTTWLLVAAVSIVVVIVASFIGFRQKLAKLA